MFRRHLEFSLLNKGCSCFANCHFSRQRSGMPWRLSGFMKALHAQGQILPRQRGSGPRFSPESALLPTLSSSTDHPVRNADAQSARFAKKNHRRSISARPNEAWRIWDDSCHTTRDKSEAKHPLRTQKIGTAPAPNVQSLGESTQAYIDFSSPSNKYSNVNPERCKVKERLAVTENASIHNDLNEILSVLSNIEDHSASLKGNKRNILARTGLLHSPYLRHSHRIENGACKGSQRCRFHWTAAVVDGARRRKPIARRISSKE